MANLHRRQAIREKIVPFTYQEARRRAGHIYEALAKEFHEDCCTTSAKHISYFGKKEARLFEEGHIRVRFFEDVELLDHIINKMKDAEISARTGSCHGPQRCFKLLHELIRFFDDIKIKYDWIIRDVYKIITGICKAGLTTPSVGTRQYIAQIFFCCAEYHYKDLQDFPMAVQYYSKTLDLVLGEPWKSKQLDEMLNYFDMRLAVARTLTEVLMKYSKEVVLLNMGKAIDLSKKAMLAAAEFGTMNDPVLFWSSFINFAENLVDNLEFRNATKILLQIPESVLQNTDSKFDQLKIRILTTKAYCEMSLDKRIDAKLHLEEAMVLVEKGGLLEQEAALYSTLGTLHSQRISENTQAIMAFEESKALYDKLGDRVGKRKCQFLLAKLNAEYRRPAYLELLRNAGQEFCSRYHLYKWKSQYAPFWNQTSHEWKQEKDDIYCLLEETSLRENANDDNENYYKLTTLAMGITKLKQLRAAH